MNRYANAKISKIKTKVGKAWVRDATDIPTGVRRPASAGPW
jgi:hypothetical protein